MSEGIDVVWEDEWLVVVDKPSGLLSVPGRGAETDPAKADCARARVQALYPLATGPVTVHRLDQDTSGLLVLALDAKSHREMSVLFQEREIDKRYVALVAGHHDHLEEGAEGVARMKIVVDWPNRPRKMVDNEKGKDSETRWRVASREQITLAGDKRIDATRIVMEPITGRGHQLRVHCAFPRDVGGLGAPILGDQLYNPKPLTDRLMLHAERLGFTHPRTGERVEIVREANF